MKLARIKYKIIQGEKLTQGEAEAIQNDNRHTQKKIKKWRSKRSK